MQRGAVQRGNPGIDGQVKKTKFITLRWLSWVFIIVHHFDQRLFPNDGGLLACMTMTMTRKVLQTRMSDTWPYGLEWGGGGMGGEEEEGGHDLKKKSFVVLLSSCSVGKELLGVHCK